ncbi:MAG: alpha/beta fold hydrolase [Sandaracinaceae bacterium]
MNLGVRAGWRTHGSLTVAAVLACASSGCLGLHTGPIPGEPEDATFASVEGARIRYVDEGEGDAVVMVHGYASSLDNWSSVRPAVVEAGHRVLALDLKGFGWSDRPEGDYSVRAQARVVLALMDERGIERASFVAHSYGCSVVLQIALMAPERVSRIALFDAFVYPDQRNTFLQWAEADGIGEALYGLFYDQRPEERMALAFFDPRALTQEFVDRTERGLERPGTAEAALRTARGMHFEHERYRDIDVPVLLLWGREDRVTPIGYGERLENELPNARLRVYPRCGHFPMIEALNPSRRDLVAFLGEATPEVSPPVEDREPEPQLRAPEVPSGAEPSRGWWEGGATQPAPDAHDEVEPTEVAP